MRIPFSQNKKHIFIIVIVVIIACVSLWWVWVTSAPRHFDTSEVVVIESGTSVKQITQMLSDVGLIRSRTIANSIIILTAGDRRVVSGEYLFEKPPTVFDVVYRITRGDFGIDSRAIRLPEGVTIQQMGELFAQEFTYFDKNAFYQLTEGKEGYLFPDTYVFLETVKAYEVVEKLESTFRQKVAELAPLLKESNRTLQDVVIMASIVEKEATAESRQEVADILWKRLEIDMPLQVDATFVYSIGRSTFDLYKSDLQNADDPYNTYVHKGLPPTAIGNPSLESLKAAATRGSTEYLFFLTGHDGEMYYAEDFDGHRENRRRHMY